MSLHRARSRQSRRSDTTRRHPRAAALGPVAALLVATIVLAPTEARATTLDCDVPPIVMGNTSSQIWAYQLDTGTVLWDFDLTVDPASSEKPESVPTFGDLGQDAAGSIYLISMTTPRQIWRLSGASGSSENNPGSGDVTFVGTLALPGDSAATEPTRNMLGFDKYGKGYVVGLADSKSVELLRFDPNVVAGDGTILLEVVAAGLEIDGVAPNQPSGDILIAGSEAFIPVLGGEILAIGLSDTGSTYSSTGSVRIAGTYSYDGPGSLNGWGTAATGEKFFIAGNDGTDPAIVEFALDGGSSTFGEPIVPVAGAGLIFGLTGNGEAVFDDCVSGGFPSSLGFLSSVSSPEPSQGSTITTEPSTPVRVAGSLPSLSAGVAIWNRGGTLTSLTATSSAARSVTYGDTDSGVRVTVTGARGSSIATGVVADAGGELVCEVCAELAAGSVIEVWMFSEPRLVAAHRIEDLPCQRFVVPLGAPLDGGESIAAGAHTLQLAVPTTAGMEAVDVGITVGGPVPTTVPAGEGPAPSPWPLALTLAAVLILGLAVTARRAVTIRS